MASFAERLKRCRSFFKKLGSKVKIQDLERRLGGKSYTIRLIRFLQKKYPAHQFHWVMGQDTYRQRAAWKDFEAVHQ